MTVLQVRNVRGALEHYLEMIDRLVEEPTLTPQCMSWLTCKRFSLTGGEEEPLSCSMHHLTSRFHVALQYTTGLRLERSQAKETVDGAVISALRGSVGCVVHSPADAQADRTAVDVPPAVYVADLAVAFGKHLHTVYCWEDMPVQEVVQGIMGSFETGGWVCLVDVDALHPSVIQLVAQAASLAREAIASASPSFSWVCSPCLERRLLIVCGPSGRLSRRKDLHCWKSLALTKCRRWRSDQRSPPPSPGSQGVRGGGAGIEVVSGSGFLARKLMGQRGGAPQAPPRFQGSA